ncbi:MAG: tRNA (N(6)-L-threonylcarbamoyladenosine(37)-C(2))-methylthiotransferase MtaB [Holosporales bacterium]|jgi:threonylcarbamoyladenosine tRNA methylthiotransferase MtaB|nr:tRNA (N(6)-L-threonylcarbamoyladenosine(37)-C(2))-methylthiotransferase MtaB [Holosporales bacterium]
MTEKLDSCVITFGCRLNTVESEHIKNVLKDNDIDDVIVVNTCAVTAEAERQARQAIRKLKLAHPERRIIVTGCAATINRALYEAMPQVDCVVLNEHKYEAQSFLSDAHAGVATEGGPLNGHAGVAVECENQSGGPQNVNKSSAHAPAAPSNALPMYSPRLLPQFEGKSRAFLQIQTGCDNFCTFCVTRLARGKSISVPLVQILEQAKQFTDMGYKEINLTGVNICSYKDEAHSLAHLITRLLSEFPEDVRIRLSSLDPCAIDDALLGVMREKRVLPHWHLSLQSGDATVLSKMLRRHTPEDVVRVVDRVRGVRPEIALGADVITGFPGETPEMFDNTCALVERCGIALLHVFPYSDRPGTVAETMTNKVPQPVKVERAKRLRRIGEQILRDEQHKLIGQIVDVFVEKDIRPEHDKMNEHLDGFGRDENKLYTGKTEHSEPSEMNKNLDSVGKDANKLYAGKTEHFFHIAVSGDDVPIGRYVKVKIDGILRTGWLCGQQTSKS